MDLKRTLVALVAVMFLCTPAFAGEQPEFDAVGCDATNFFNDFVKGIVIQNNVNWDGRLINMYSDFRWFEPARGWIEYFYQHASQEKLDPCFNLPLDGLATRRDPYLSHMITAWNGGWFEWQIMLQKKPDTDLDINIRDCVLKMNSFTPFGDEPFEGASQTGRYIMPWGQSFWLIDSNPRISVVAFPGQYGNIAPGTVLDCRTTPGLHLLPLLDQLYTSKALWEESVVVVMPEDGEVNLSGQVLRRLEAGDMIRIRVDVPTENTVDLYYGQDNVVVKYVGVHGSEFLADFWCLDSTL